MRELQIPPQLLPHSRKEFVNRKMLEFWRRNKEFLLALDRKAGRYTEGEWSYGHYAHEMLEMYTADDRGGPLAEATIRYALPHKKKAGRLTARGTDKCGWGGMQAIEKTIRNSLLYRVARDWDIRNCHPVTLEQLCTSRKIPCNFLRKYLEEREAILADLVERLAITRDEAKEMILAIVNGGSFEVERNASPWLDAFCREMRRVQQAIAKAFPEIHKLSRGKPNALGKTMSNVLCMVENGLLKAMVDALEDADVIPRALIYDGLNTDYDVPTAGLAAKMERRVLADTGFKVEIVEKEFVEVDLVALAAELGVDLVPEPEPEVPLRDPEDEMDHDVPDFDFDDAFIEAAMGPYIPDLVDDDDDENQYNGRGYSTVIPDIRKVPQVSVPYIPNDCFLELAKVHRFISIQAGMEMGKTLQTIRLILSFVEQGKTVVVITQRISQAASAHCRLWEESVDHPVLKAFKRYDKSVDEGGAGQGELNPKEHPQLICNYESLGRERGHYDLVVMDEFRSICSSMVSTTNGSGSKIINHLDVLKDLWHGSKNVIMLDADMEYDDAAYDAQEILAKYCECKQAEEIDKEVLALTGSLPVLRETDQLEFAVARDRVVELATEAVLLRTRPAEIHREIFSERQQVRHQIEMVPDACVEKFKEMVQEGKRAAACCGSIAHANVLYAAALEILKEQGNTPEEAAELIALHTADTDNSGIADIHAAWDPKQVIIYTSCITTGADYKTLVNGLFAFPCARTCTARDMSQMAGRIRNVENRTMYVACPVEVMSCGMTSKAEIRAEYSRQLGYLQHGEKYLEKEVDEIKKTLAFTVPTETLARKFVRTPSDIMIMAAHASTETVMCSSDREFMRAWRYLAHSKGYSREFPFDGMSVDRDVAEDLKQARIETRAATIAKKNEEVKKLDVRPLLGNAEMFDVMKMASRKERGVNRALVRQGLVLCGANEDQMELLVQKAVTTLEFDRKDPASINFEDIDALNKNANALAVRDLIDGGEYALVAYDMFNTCTTQDAQGIARAHIMQKAKVVQGLMDLMGLEGIHDTHTEVKEPSVLERPRATRAVTAMRTANVGRRNKGTLFQCMQTMTCSTIGVRFTKEGKMRLTEGIQRVYTFRSGNGIKRWFDERNGDIAILGLQVDSMAPEGIQCDGTLAIMEREYEGLAEEQPIFAPALQRVKRRREEVADMSLERELMGGEDKRARLIEVN